jgi:hypothetical protein
MDGWWRDVDDDGDEDLLQIPIPTGCQNGVSGSELWFLMVAAQRKSIWEKCRTSAIFRSEGICRRKEGSRRWPRQPHHRWARPGLGRVPLVVSPGHSPLCLSFSLRGSSGKIEFLQYFLGFFLKVRFLHKNETPEQFCWKQRYSVLVVFKTHKLEEKQ